MRPLMSLGEHAEQAEMAGSSRWMVSYADFITLLFVMFLVLYSMAPKTAGSPPISTSKPTIASQKDVASQAKQAQLITSLKASLAGMVDAGDVSLVSRPDGMLLEIKDTALFATGTAQPASQASNLLARIADVLITVHNSVVVEGHTDSIPIQTAQFPSNWELSSSRAAAVVRNLQEQGIAPTRLAASGLADTKPRATNATIVGRSQNRRVSLLILND